MLPLWIRRVHPVSVDCPPDKAPLVLAAGAQVGQQSYGICDHHWP